MAPTLTLSVFPPMPSDPERIAQPFTDAELDALASVTPQDIERATLAWAQDAPPQYRDLLNAEPEDGSGELSPAAAEGGGCRSMVASYRGRRFTGKPAGGPSTWWNGVRWPSVASPRRGRCSRARTTAPPA